LLKAVGPLIPSGIFNIGAGSVAYSFTGIWLCWRTRPARAFRRKPLHPTPALSLSGRCATARARVFGLTGRLRRASCPAQPKSAVLGGFPLTKVVRLAGKILNPDFIIADEPISALDVSIQAQIINLFSDLRDDHGVTFLFISHDLGVVEHLCDDVAVMYLGQIVETADRDSLFRQPLHPYTQALLAAVPTLDPDSGPVAMAQGEIPDPSKPPTGCRFNTRCPLATDRCRQEVPILREISDATGHHVACHLV